MRTLLINTVRRSRWALLAATVVLAGCTEHTLDPISTATVDERPGIAAKQVRRAQERAPKSVRETVGDALRPNGEFFRTAAEIRAEPSARCRRVLAGAGIAATSLRSPSLSAEVTDEGNASLGLGYDLMDWKRANLTEEMAFARCEKTEISSKLTLLTVTSSQALTRSGFLARLRVLEANRGELKAIRRRLNRAVSEGVVTIGAATTLRQYISQVESQEASTRGEAALRQAVDALHQTDFIALDRRLMAIEDRIHDIESRQRTAEAIQLKGSVSYGDDLNSGLGNGDDDVTAKIEMAVRLGAFYSRRRELEEISREAAMSLHREKGSGVLWRVGVVEKSIAAIVEALQARRRDLLKAMAEAKRNSVVPADTAFAEDLIGARLRARVDRISLRAEIAAIDATMVDTKRILAKLRFRR